MKKEYKYFFFWLISLSNLLLSFLWIVRKLYKKLIIKNRKHEYPYEIKKLIDSLDIYESKILLNKQNYNFQFNIDKIQLAGINIQIDKKLINWYQDFNDTEDVESLHRWNWMIYSISNINNMVDFNELIFYQRDWYDKFIYELKNKKNLNHPRWESYTISERISNSIIVSNYYNKKIPGDILECIKKQSFFLIKNLEYFGNETGNHIINNARALYLYSIYHNNKKIQILAKSIFYDQVSKLITKDGFLREGSSHYHFLFLRWLIEVNYFAKKNEDYNFSKFISKYILMLIKSGINFLYEKEDKSYAISLFGDISPDCNPSWLSDVIFSKICPFEIENLPFKSSKDVSWNNLWLNEDRAISRTLATSIKFDNLKQLSYTNSGWYFLKNGFAKIILRADSYSLPGHVGHHNHDLLHSNIIIDKKPFLISQGRLNYTFKNSEGLFSTAHNSILINNLGYIPNKPNLFPRKYAQSQNKILLEKNELLVSSSGFKRINSSINVTRTFRLEKNFVTINDSLIGNGKYLVQRFFYINSSFELINNKIICDSKIELVFKSNEHLIYFEIDGKSIDKLDLTVSKNTRDVYSYGQFNKCLGIKVESYCLFPNELNIKIKKKI